MTALEKLAREYRPSMDAEVLHSWAADVIAALKAVPAEPVAWRWTWKSATEDDGWAYTETVPTGFDGQRIIEPLYATPQPLPPAGGTAASMT